MIDGVEIFASQRRLLIIDVEQDLFKKSRSIPSFCFHPKLSLSGNCRMCLVEITGSAKPMVACCTPINNEMKVFTQTPLILESREFILEFLLVNHPLDCPICDQAGECDLQDLSFV